MRPDGEGATGIAFLPFSGALMGWLEPNSDDLVRISLSTGAATIVGDSGLNTYGSGLEFDNSLGKLILAGEGEAGPLRTVDFNTGATTQIATLNGNSTNAYPIAALAFDGTGTLFGVRVNTNLATRPTELITINPATGAITSLGPSVDGLDAIEFASVPSARTITLDATKAKKGKQAAKQARLRVQKGKKVKFSGQVSSPEDPSACQANQELGLYRKKPKATKYKLFDLVFTDAAGSFSTTVKIRKTFEWLVVLPDAPRCDHAASNSEKVKAKKKP
jgi:hypothetical protein